MHSPLDIALNASAPAGFKCVDCLDVPCPNCYASWWFKKYPLVIISNLAYEDPDRGRPH